MSRRFFTVAEVDGFVPALERLFIQVYQLRVALQKEEQKLSRVGVRLSKETLDAPDAREPMPVRQAKAMFRGYFEAMTEALRQIEALGAEIKDIDTGLVDFPGKRGSEEVCLCWKMGERSVTHWHTVDSGFAGRRPLAELLAHDPPAAE